MCCVHKANRRNVKISCYPSVYPQIELTVSTEVSVTKHDTVRPNKSVQYTISQSRQPWSSPKLYLKLPGRRSLKYEDQSVNAVSTSTTAVHSENHINILRGKCWTLFTLSGTVRGYVTTAFFWYSLTLWESDFRAMVHIQCVVRGRSPGGKRRNLGTFFSNNYNIETSTVLLKFFWCFEM
jgi:hypothetical protein